MQTKAADTDNHIIHETTTVTSSYTKVRCPQNMNNEHIKSADNVPYKK